MYTSTSRSVSPSASRTFTINIVSVYINGLLGLRGVAEENAIGPLSAAQREQGDAAAGGTQKPQNAILPFHMWSVAS